MPVNNYSKYLLAVVGAAISILKYKKIKLAIKENDVVQVLKMRLAKGEITKEELRD